MNQSIEPSLIPNELIQQFLLSLFCIEALYVMAAVYVLCEALYALPHVDKWKDQTKQAVASVLGVLFGFLLLPTAFPLSAIQGLILGFATTRLVARLDKYFGGTGDVRITAKEAKVLTAGVAAEVVKGIE